MKQIFTWLMISLLVTGIQVKAQEAGKPPAKPQDIKKADSTPRKKNDSLSANAGKSNNGIQKYENPCKDKKWLKKDFDFVFDSSGRLIHFPSAVVRANEEICLKVIVPAGFIYRQIENFRSNLQATHDSLKVVENLKHYICYFEGSGFLFQKYVDSLKLLIDYFNDPNWLLKFACQGNKTYQLGSFQYVPAFRFLENVFKNQFKIKVSSGSADIITMDLKMGFDDEDSCFYFTNCRDLSSLICKNCGNQKPAQLNFELVRTDPYNQTLKEWFELRNIELGKIETTAQLHQALTDMAGATSTTDADFTDAHGRVGKFLKLWFPYWFWYNGGKFTLDPFETVSGSLIKDLKKQVDTSNVHLEEFRQQKSFLDSVLKKVDHKINQFALFKEVQDTVAWVNKKIDSVSNVIKDADKVLNAKATGYDAHSRHILNEVPLFISYYNVIRPQHQMDAIYKYRLVANTKRRIRRVVEMPDDENPVLVLYNIDSSQHLSFKQAPADFKDEDEFTAIVSEQLEAAETALQDGSKIPAVQQFMASFAKGGAVSLLGSASDTTIPCVAADQFKDNVIYKDIKSIARDFAAKKITVFYEKNIFNEEIPPTSNYYTLSEMDLYKSKTPYTDSVGIISKTANEEKKIGQTYINIGKLRFIQLAMGIALNRKPVESVNVDTTGSGFRVTSSDNRARAVLGFKIYPFQQYNRDRSLWPRYFLRRLSVFVGFELLKPTDNFYLGGSYDLVPGFCFSVGANYQLHTTYKIENNAITDTRRTYKSTGPYYSVMVNPKLFIRYVKLFFKAI